MKYHHTDLTFLGSNFNIFHKKKSKKQKYITHNKTSMRKIIIVLIFFLSSILTCNDLSSKFYDIKFEVTSSTTGANADIEYQYISLNSDSDNVSMLNKSLPWSSTTELEVINGGNAFISLTATNNSGSSENLVVSIYVDGQLVDYMGGTCNNGFSHFASYSIYNK